MLWNYLQLQLVPEDLRIDPMIGPGDLTREQAHAEIQTILDRMVTELGLAQVAPLAETWRRGAEDDTVHYGPFTFAIYEHEQGQGAAMRGALEWIEDYANILRSQGLNVGITQPPE